MTKVTLWDKESLENVGGIMARSKEKGENGGFVENGMKTKLYLNLWRTYGGGGGIWLCHLSCYMMSDCLSKH